MLFTRVRSVSVLGLAAVCLCGLLAPIGCAFGTYTEKPGAEGDGSFTVGPDYPIDPDLTDKGNPKGKSFEFTLRLAGMDERRTRRRVKPSSAPAPRTAPGSARLR